MRRIVPLLLLAALPLAAQDAPPAVLDGWMAHTDAPNTLYHLLHRQARTALDERDRHVASLATRDDWTAYRQHVRRQLQAAAGPFPERTDLNARVTGTVERDGYRIEKVIFESQPGLHVTAAFYLPDDFEAPGPAVVYCSGHTELGFRSETYQTMILNLVLRGFAVFAFDPIGQGERLQYVDPATGASRVGGATKEHGYAGAQARLTGQSLAGTMIWDGIRAVDYLLTRPEVDPERIGITGRSGGGTQSALIAAYDDRIAAAAPENYITNFGRLLASRGPQDAEQNLRAGLALGLDHADLLLARAPAATLVIATTRDIFSIQGVRETVAEVERAYAALGRPDAFRFAVDDHGHGSTASNREAMVRFFRDALDHPGPVDDLTPDVPNPEDLRVTPTGQVRTAYDETTVFDLTAREARRLTEGRSTNPDSIRAAARRLSGGPATSVEPQPVFTGRHRYDGYALETYFLAYPSGAAIPFLLFVPDAPGPHPAVLVLHPEGKAAAAGSEGDIPDLVRRGHVVLAPDLPGLGELGPGEFTGDAHTFAGHVGAYNLWFFADLLDTSLVGIRAGVVSDLTVYLKAHPAVSEVRARAVGPLGPVLLHAAAFDDSIEAVTLVESLVSYADLATTEAYRPEWIHAAVPDALTAYDLPTLAATLAPRPLTLVRPLDAAMQPVDPGTASRAYDVTRAAYAEAGAADRFEIMSPE